MTTGKRNECRLGAVEDHNGHRPDLPRPLNLWVDVKVPWARVWNNMYRTTPALLPAATGLVWKWRKYAAHVAVKNAKMRKYGCAVWDCARCVIRYWVGYAPILDTVPSDLLCAECGCAAPLLDNTVTLAAA